MLNVSTPGLWSRSYSPTSNLFTEQKMPDTLQTTPVIRMHTSVRCSLLVSRPLCSLRWHRHGSMRVMAAPVTLPVKPISSENLGTNRARKYDAISRAARTSRAGREIPEPSASVGEAERVAWALQYPSVFLLHSLVIHFCFSRFPSYRDRPTTLLVTVTIETCQGPASRPFYVCGLFFTPPLEGAGSLRGFTLAHLYLHK